ncbi:MAG: hypothetical protein AAF821_20410 [Cyanobacteria bacterium P01_D01_bin.156]
MEAFASTPPEWVDSATHALSFCCPACNQTASVATDVWINRRAPVYTQNHRRKWQEFYKCECGKAWWAWSSDRPPNPWQVESEESSPDLDSLTGLGDIWGSSEP